MASTGAQTITAKQLIILQYMLLRLTAQEPVGNPPYGWTSLDRMEKKIRFGDIDPDNPRQPINEDLFGTHDGIFPLTGQRAEHMDPFLIVHTGQQSYRISQTGVNIAKTCALKKIKTPAGKDQWIVIDKRTGKPPVIETTSQDETGVGLDDFTADEEGDDEDSPPIVHTAEEIVGQDEGEEEGEQGGGEFDEINNPRERTAPPMTAKTEPSKAPPRPGSNKQPQTRKPTKARVPGRE